MTTRERKSAAVWLFAAPGLIFFSAGAVVGLYAVVDGAYHGNFVDIGLGLVMLSTSVYLVIKFVRAPLRTRPNSSNPP